MDAEDTSAELSETCPMTSRIARRACSAACAVAPTSSAEMAWAATVRSPRPSPSMERRTALTLRSIRLAECSPDQMLSRTPARRAAPITRLAHRDAASASSDAADRRALELVVNVSICLRKSAYCGCDSCMKMPKPCAALPLRMAFSARSAESLDSACCLRMTARMSCWAGVRSPAGKSLTLAASAFAFSAYALALVWSLAAAPLAISPR